MALCSYGLLPVMDSPQAADYLAMAHLVTAYLVMAHLVMAYLVMAYLVVALSSYGPI